MEFETEEQQVEAIKKWFSEYGVTIIVGLVIGLGGVFGYREYVDHTETEKQIASAAYESIMLVQTTTPNTDNFVAAISEFKAANGASVYANMLDLQLSKAAVDAKDLALAESTLSNVINTAQHPTIEHTARLRLARVQIAQEKYEEALTTISQASESAYAYNYELLRGDIWLARGDETRAKAAYEKAKALTTDAPQHPDLDMILTELASAGDNKEAQASSGETND